MFQHLTFAFPQFQALSYFVVIRRSGDAVDGKYSITSVTAALYLLVQTASPDLRTGFSLLADSASRRYFVFGACLLVVFALLITAAMKTIFSSAENDAGVVANAVTVLFVADLVSSLRPHGKCCVGGATRESTKISCRLLEEMQQSLSLLIIDLNHDK